MSIEDIDDFIMTNFVKISISFMLIFSVIILFLVMISIVIPMICQFI